MFLCSLAIDIYALFCLVIVYFYAANDTVLLDTIIDSKGIFKRLNSRSKVLYGMVVCLYALVLVYFELFCVLFYYLSSTLI